MNASTPDRIRSAELELVSVIVPAYNRAATIGATLDSILRQEGWPFELIVVDDGSRDGTAEIARRHAPEDDFSTSSIPTI